MVNAQSLTALFYKNPDLNLMFILKPVKSCSCEVLRKRERGTVPQGDGGNNLKSETRNKKKNTFKNKHPSLQRRLAQPTDSSSGPNELFPAKQG